MKVANFFSLLVSALIFLSACNDIPVTPVENTQQPSENSPQPTAIVVVNTPIPAVTTAAEVTEVVIQMTVVATETQVSTSSTQCTNSAQFLSDGSIPDGTVMSDDVDFVKTWRVKNTGTCAWDSSYSLVFSDGTNFSSFDRVALPFTVAPGQTTDLSLNMTSPIYPGTYRSDWKFQAPNGSKFGVDRQDSPLWVKVTVEQEGVTTISGFVYQNWNGNPKYDFDDELMVNREVWLLQGSCGSGGARLASGISGNDGRYIISGQFNGTYCLSLQRPDQTVYTSTISVTAGQHLDSADMQDAIPNLVISGNVWNDSAQPDGTQQSVEADLAGVTVLLQAGSCANPTSLVPISSTTDTQGNFSFVNLYGGTYCVSIRAGEAGNSSILQSGSWTTPVTGSEQVAIRLGEQKAVSFGWQYE